ncbi:hypothetical protein RJ641_022292 [Dillenia turbinata]|uniref:Uncharacterized protein n=1 Tax=Dillenia turbinata TaxID=194707 RepID=A0AAN8YTR7_9MAGN
MASSGREARRRRILERGSNRLALITGQIKHLPPSSPSDDAAATTTTISSPDSQSQSLLPDPINVSPKDEIEPTASLMPEHSSSSRSRGISEDGGTRLDSYLPEHETSAEAPIFPALEISEQAQLAAISSSAKSTSISSSHTVQPSALMANNFFNPKQISSAIKASETTRVYCALVVALLVVLSHWGVPILGSETIKTIISFRPLYLVLLTNVTVVLAQLLYEKQSGLHVVGHVTSKAPADDGYVWAEQAGNALEKGLLMQAIVSALFMDCSVYAVVVICGLFLMR